MISLQTPLVHAVLILIVVGVLLGLINRFIPMASSIKSIINGLVVIVVVLYLLRFFNVIGPIPGLGI